MSIYVFSLSNENYRMYLKFDKSSIPTITNKVLMRVYCYSAEGTQPRTYEVRRVTGSWTETGITWNNQPATTDTNKTDFTTTGSGKWHEFDITSMFGDETGSYISIQVRDKNENAGGGWAVCRYRSYDYDEDMPHLRLNSYYVKPSDGDDSKDGKSWANAWKTINKAATTVADGSTVHIGFGTYDAEPAANKIAPQNVGAFGIYYLPETATTGGGTGTVSIEQNT